MRVARPVLILFALIMFIICFNAPTVFSGDEHPWDQDGVDPRTGGGAGIPDTTHILTGTTALSTTSGGKTIIGPASRLDYLIIYFKFVTWYRDLPRLRSVHLRGVEENVRSISTVNKSR